MSGHWQCHVCGSLTPDGEAHSCNSAPVVTPPFHDKVEELEAQVKGLEAVFGLQEQALIRLRQRIAERDEDLELNADMLAKQRDLTREAEIRVKMLEAVAEAASPVMRGLATLMLVVTEAGMVRLLDDPRLKPCEGTGAVLHDALRAAGKLPDENPVVRAMLDAHEATKDSTLRFGPPDPLEDYTSYTEVKQGMNVQDIVEAWLRENGYDGLYNDDGGCCCKVGDLMPCCEIGRWCMAGVLAPCDGTCDAGKCDFHIVEKK